MKLSREFPIFHLVVAVFLLLSQYNHVAAKKKKYILKHIAKKMRIPNHDLAVTHCVSQPCGDTGHCVVDLREKTGIVCYCKTGFTGMRCETEIEECDQTPCRNKGTCINTENGFFCSCPKGFTGHHCETGTGETENMKIVERREEPEKVIEGTDTFIGLIVFFVISCWVFGCSTCWLIYRNKKKQKSYKYDESPLDFGDPEAVRKYADLAMETKQKEEEEREAERKELLSGWRAEEEPSIEVAFEGAVSSKVLDEEGIVEEHAMFVDAEDKKVKWA